MTNLTLEQFLSSLTMYKYLKVTRDSKDKLKMDTTNEC